MTPRSIRRAAERKALKEARKAERLTTQEPVDLPETEPMESMPTEAQLTANRANALKSTGPRTEEGRLRIRHNAVRHALTGRSVLLPTDDAVLYENHCQAFHADFQPVGVREQLLVQAIADHHWRLSRVPSLEAALYAVGREQLAAKCEDPALLDVHIYLAYEKQLRNLQLQESRLARYLQKDMAELIALQKARAEDERKQFEAAAALAAEAKAKGQPFRPDQFGFVFSTLDIEAFTDAKATSASPKN